MSKPHAPLRDPRRWNAHSNRANPESFRQNESIEKLHYATARYVCQWLDARGLLWKFYRAWRDGFDDDPTGAKTFVRVTATPPSAANAAWTAWVKAL